MSQTTYRFGTFAVDPESHTLLMSGTRVPIQEQPFQVLLALLEEPGNVVTREALRARLWGTNTFVDFDQSLNSAVRRLRLALGDNSREPSFVETLPRVGFRFLAQVEADQIPVHTAEAPTPRRKNEIQRMTVLTAETSRESASTRRGLPVLAGALIFLAGLLLGHAPLSIHASAAKSTQRSSVQAQSRGLHASM